MLNALPMRLETFRRGATPTRGAFLGVSLLSALAVVFTGAQARAQSTVTPGVTNVIGTVARLDPQNQNADNYASGEQHPGGVAENVVNFDDCENDLRFRFTLGLSGDFSSYDLVAWVGPDDCTAAAARSGSTATCWPLASAPLQQGSTTSDAGVVYESVVDIHMRDLAAYAGSTSVVTTYAAASESACQVQSTTTATSLTIYFFFTDRIGVGNAIGYAQGYPITIDTRAEAVGDTGFEVEQDLDRQLTVNITAGAANDTVSYNVYCDPPVGQEPVVTPVPYDAATNNGQCPAVTKDSVPDTSDAASSDASASVDSAAEDAATESDSAAAPDSSGPSAEGGADASPHVDAGPPPVDDAGGKPCGVPLNDSGVPIIGSCIGSALQSGGGVAETTTDEAGASIPVEGGTVSGGTQVKSIAQKYSCGTATIGSPTVVIPGLRDGTTYTIAVAAVDSAGNVGPLGTTCKTVQQVSDFWNGYTTAGGQAGGGYCSAAEGVGVPAGTTGLGLLMMASMIAVVRKRRR